MQHLINIDAIDLVFIPCNFRTMIISELCLQVITVCMQLNMQRH